MQTEYMIMHFHRSLGVMCPNPKLRAKSEKPTELGMLDKMIPTKPKCYSKFLKILSIKKLATMCRAE